MVRWELNRSKDHLVLTQQGITLTRRVSENLLDAFLVDASLLYALKDGDASYIVVDYHPETDSWDCPEAFKSVGGPLGRVFVSPSTIAEQFPNGVVSATEFGYVIETGPVTFQFQYWKHHWICTGASGWSVQPPE